MNTNSLPQLIQLLVNRFFIAPMRQRCQKQAISSLTPLLSLPSLVIKGDLGQGHLVDVSTAKPC